MCFETNDSPATGGEAQKKRSRWNTFPPFLEKSLLALTTSSPAPLLTGPGPQGTENPSQVLEEAQEKGTKEKRKRKKERDRSKVESKEEQGTTQGKVAEGTQHKTPFTTQPVTGSFPWREKHQFSSKSLFFFFFFEAEKWHNGQEHSGVGLSPGVLPMCDGTRALKCWFEMWWLYLSREGQLNGRIMTGQPAGLQGTWLLPLLI